MTGATGADGIAWRRGEPHLAAIRAVEEGCRRLLWIGENRKAKTLLRRAVERALYHVLGGLPEPQVSHRFC